MKIDIDFDFADDAAFLQVLAEQALRNDVSTDRLRALWRQVVARRNATPQPSRSESEELTHRIALYDAIEVCVSFCV